MAGISFRCNSHELAAVFQFPLSANGQKPLATTKQRTSFQRQIISHVCDAFRYLFFAAGPLWIGISHIFSPLNCFFCLKSKFLLNLIKNISSLMQKEDLWTNTIFDPC
jgi:hypothetical protein